MRVSGVSRFWWQVAQQRHVPYTAPAMSTLRSGFTIKALYGSAQLGKNTSTLLSKYAPPPPPDDG